MGWFKKKEDKGGLPELPPLPDDFGKPKELNLPNLPSIKDELPPLPTFPSNKIGEKLSQEILKQSIKDSEFKPSDFPPLAEEKEEVEIKPRVMEIQETFKPKSSVREIKPALKIEPVYVRMDKYQESLSAFHEVKKKLMEIENSIKDVRDLKAREEIELQGWEEEVRKAKEKLVDIDSILFQKLGDS